MFLQRLIDYASRLSLPPTLYAEAPVRYIIELDESGGLLNPQPTDTADRSSPRTRRGEPRLVPRVQRTVKIKPLLLADNAEYTLGLVREGSDPERAAQCHQAYRDLIARCAEATREPAVQAVRRFLEGDPLSRLCLPGDWDPSASVTFRVAGVFPVELPAVQAFWAAENDPSLDPERPAPLMQCVVCGERRPVLRRLQTKVKGVPGGQTSGTAIISANAAAFESYGLEESLIAPTCAACGERFTLALNELLANPDRHMAIGGAVLVFWTREEHPFSLRSLLADPQPQEVAALIEAVRRGGPVPDVDETAFYAATLSASGGRTVVRDWIDTTVGQVKRHLGAWFRGQAVVGAYGEPPRPLGVFALAAATVREAKDLAPPTPRALWRTALSGVPLPMAVLYEAVRRNRAERDVTRPRAALIKLVLCSRQPAGAAGDPQAKEDVMAQLDPHSTDPAYLCGRLLAVIEEAQRLALPGINATVVDRFFGAASSAPASVYGRLLRGVQPHLSKLKRDRPAASRAIERRLEEILASLPTFPRVLTLEEQGLFALGYYHQRAFDRAQARETAARKERLAASAGEEDLTALADLESENKGGK